MIPDWRKTEVYVSEILKESYPKEFNAIELALSNKGVHLHQIQQTKDIWARDYMPIQVTKEAFVQFKYNPSYLRNSEALKTDPSKIGVLKSINLKESNINLDGGNVVCSSDKVILTERVIKENPSFSPTQLQAQLEKTFDAEVYFVPDIKEDLTGHIDGQIRFLNENTIIVNQLDMEYVYWQKGFHKMIQASGLNYVEMPWYTDKRDKEKISAIGSYLNYLHLESIILFPIFNENKALDLKCIEIIQNHFPSINVVPLNINAIGKKGGLLNCITWTIG